MVLILTKLQADKFNHRNGTVNKVLNRRYGAGLAEL